MSPAAVAIVNLGMGNLFSVKQACEHAGLAAEITADRAAIEAAPAVILPGVGAFGAAMAAMAEKGLAEPLKKAAASGKPLMGICLGMQLLFDESEEFGRHRGLGIVAGKVVKFQAAGGRAVKVPQVGWNRVSPPAAQAPRWPASPLGALAAGSFVYFVHSFYCVPSDPAVVLAETEYEGTRYCSALERGAVFAVQFHPEKSAALGVDVYRRWAQKIQRSA